MPLLPKERGWRDTESQDAPFGERESEGVGGGVGRGGERVGGWAGSREQETRQDAPPAGRDTDTDTDDLHLGHCPS